MSTALEKDIKTKKRLKTKTKSPHRTQGTHLTTTNPEVGKRIIIYRNADPYHKGVNVVLNMKHKHDINAFLDAISERIGLINGVRRLYTLNGIPIRTTQQLENNHAYVASAGGFMPLDYGAAYRRQQSAFLPVKSGREDSTLSLASKRSAPARLTRSATNLHSTSRDVTAHSLNENKTPSRARSEAPKRSKSLRTRKANKVVYDTFEDKPSNTTKSKKKKIIKTSDDLADKNQQNVNKKKKKRTKNKVDSKESVATRVPPTVVVNEIAFDHSPTRPLTRSSTRLSTHANSNLGNNQRPLSRHSTRSAHETSSSDQHEDEETNDDALNHSRRRSISSNDEERPRTTERTKTGDVNHRLQSTQSHYRHFVDETHHQHSDHDGHTTATHSGVSDESEDESKNLQQQRPEDGTQAQVPLDAL